MEQKEKNVSIFKPKDRCMQLTIGMIFSPPEKTHLRDINRVINMDIDSLDYIFSLFYCFDTFIDMIYFLFLIVGQFHGFVEHEKEKCWG